MTAFFKLILISSGAMGVKFLYYLLFIHLLSIQYDDFSANTYTGEIPKLTQCRFTGSEVRVRDDTLPLAHIAMAVEGAGWSDPDTLSLMVGSTLLGAWDRSQASAKQNATNLARASGEEDLCHSFQSFNTCYKVSVNYQQTARLFCPLAFSFFFPNDHTIQKYKTKILL